MHIALYIGSLEKGGAQRVLVNLAKGFLAAGDAVTFVTTFREADEFPLPEGAYRLISGLTPEEETAGRAANIILRRKKLTRIWKDLRPDIILSFIGKNNVMAIQTAAGLKIPVVVSVRSDPAREYRDKVLFFAMRASFPKAAGIIVQTLPAADFFPPALKDRCRVLPNMLSEEFIHRSVTSGRRKEVVLVGRLDDNKNQIMAVKAFALTAVSFPDWTMTLYGEGEARGRIETLIRELHQTERIRLAGVVSDVADRIADASVFVLPSKEEGMPNALMEAMASGLAVIATDCPVGAVRELLQDGARGLLVPTDDVQAMSDALTRLMRDDALRSRLSEAALSVRTEYAPDGVIAQWRAYLEEIVDAV